MQRILYIDDDEILVRLVRKVLRRSGFEVLHAEEPEAALDILDKEAVAAVVLDHYLRSGTGHDVLRRLRERGVTVPVVYVTASAEANVAVVALQSGASDYVIKSGGEDFLALLERSIRQSIANAELARERERATVELRRAKERAEALLVEVNHRVANSLALVTSLLRLQAGASEAEAVKTVLDEACRRIGAIVNVHRSLYHEEEVQTVRMDRYLQSLVSDLSMTIPKHTRLVLDADPVRITSDRAVAVGIIVTELVANAAKYAYPDGRAGQIRVRLKDQADGVVRICVEDDGIGAAEGEKPAGTGLGQRIVRAMAGSLDADLKVGASGSGTTAEVTFVARLKPEPKSVASVA